MTYTRFFSACALCTLLIASPLVAAERYKLRAPGGMIAGMENEVGVWKSASAAKAAHQSLVTGDQFMSKQLACIVRGGTKAEVLERSGGVVVVRASNALLGGCKGYVKTEFLSAN